MFGKTKDPTDNDGANGSDLTVDDFFGDEEAVAEAVRVDHLQQRVLQVEQQVNSQFTSLAAYAQIAQEQVEMVRSEALHANERSEQKLISLVERERSDRLAEATGGIDVTARLDALDTQLAELREGLRLCLSNQKALADAITDLFAPSARVDTSEPMTPESPDTFSTNDADPFPANGTDTNPVPQPAAPLVPADPLPAPPNACAFEDAQPVHVPTSAATLGALPPPLANDAAVLAGHVLDPTDGPIQALSLD